MNQIKVITILALALIINGTTYTPAETKDVKATNKVEITNTQPAKEDMTEVVVKEDIVYPKSYVQKGFEDVKKAFDKMIKSYETKNIDDILNLISDRDNVIFISSGSDILIGKNQINNAFSKDFKVTKKINMTVPWVYITGKGDVATVTAIIDANITLKDQVTNISARQTMTFEKEKDGWKIINSHLSFPAERAIDESVVEVDEIEANLRNRIYTSHIEENTWKIKML